MIKLLMSWDIKASKEREFLDFLMQEFTPAIQKLGLQPTDAWLTVYGEGPQVLAGGVTEDMEAMTALLDNSQWRELEGKLLEYVTNYKRKVVLAEGGFQLYCPTRARALPPKAVPLLLLFVAAGAAFGLDL